MFSMTSLGHPGTTLGSLWSERTSGVSLIIFILLQHPECGTPVRNGWQDASERAPHDQVETQRGQRVEEQLLHLCREQAPHCTPSGAFRNLDHFEGRVTKLQLCCNCIRHMCAAVGRKISKEHMLAYSI